MKKASAIILSAIILIASAISVSALSGNINGANWMSSLNGSVPITAINIPGTHDSATQYVSFSRFARTQSMSILQQLYSGVRYLDIRLKIKSNSIIAVHSVATCKKSIGLFPENLTAKDIVYDCKDFLEKNPGETILFLIKQEDEKKDTVLFSKFYDELIVPFPQLWFTENRIPDLDEVRGKIVLLRNAIADSSRFDDSTGGINFESYPYIETQELYDYRYGYISSSDHGFGSFMYVQDSYMLEGEKKIATIEGFWEETLYTSDFNICCTNAHNKKSPVANAKEINAFLSSYDFKEGGYYGIVSMDFATKELCEKVYMTNSPIMTNTPSLAEIPRFSGSYTFMGRIFEIIRDFFVKTVVY